MSIDRPIEPRTRVLVGVAVFVAIVAVGLIDGITSAYVALSPFYIVPIAAAAWFVGRRTALAAALASAGWGFFADWLTIHSPLGYAVWNLGARLFLFVGIALVVTRLRTALGHERDLAAREHELSELKSEVMRRVAEDSRQPLGDIYARVVSLGFDAESLSDDELRVLMTDLANATAKLSTVVGSLEEPAATTTIR